MVYLGDAETNAGIKDVKGHKKRGPAKPPPLASPPIGVAEAMHQAIGFFQSGRLAEALKACRRILSQHPRHVDALHLAGVVSLQTGDTNQAQRLIRSAAKLDPGNAHIFVNLATVLYELEQFGEAEVHCRKALEIDPGHVDALYTLGNVLRAQGRLEEAVAVYRKVLDAIPDHGEILTNLGNVYLEQGKSDEAIASYRAALEAMPGAVKTWNNLGILLNERSEWTEAEAALRRALALDTGHSGVLVNLGRALEGQGKREEALNVYRRSLAGNQNQVPVHFRLADILWSLGRYDESEAAYRACLELQPDHVEAIGFLAALLERQNRLDEVSALVTQGLEHAPEDPRVNLVAAMCERREGRFKEGVARVEKALEQDPAPRLQSEIHFEMGLLLDRVGKFAKAYTHFQEANRIIVRFAADQGIDKTRFTDKLDKLHELTSGEWVCSWSEAAVEDGRTDPVFVIGFPRSGTTLLEQVLDSHPDIHTVDELPLIYELEKAVAAMPGGYPEALADLDSKRVAKLREMYFRDAGRYWMAETGRILIDKLPLNICNVALIQRVFPGAKFILALRHPHDVCLSCFMQNFQMNSAMANFLTLEDTARLYARVMDLWQRSVEVLAPRVHVLHYEDLVGNLEAEAARLLDFLDLEWDDAILTYADTARRRKKIHTPSYQQVTEGLYTRATGRWRRYGDAMAPIIEILEPYVKSFGYD